MRRSATPTWILALALLGGCWHASPAVVFHTLQPLSEVEGNPGLQAKSMALEIMPVQLPELLERPQIVLLKAPGSHSLSENHRWGNTLEKDMQRVLAENLSVLLGSESVVLYPQGEKARARYQIALDVAQCDGTPGGTLQFQATWTVTSITTGQVVLLRRVSLLEPVPAEGVEGLVSAHSKVLGILSRSIAAELESLPVPEK
jgi:uncharacterized lipoprotein YmbA